MLIKFVVGNIPVAKFVSRTIVDSFIAHFIISISGLPYSDVLLSTKNHVCSHHYFSQAAVVLTINIPHCEITNYLAVAKYLFYGYS